MFRRLFLLSVMLGASPAAVPGMAPSVAAAAPLSLNLATSLADTKRILNNGGQADIVVLGDSLSFRPGSYLPVFRNLLQSRYGNGGEGYQGFSLWTGAGFNSGWLSQGVNTDMSPHRSLDGLWNRWDGVSGFPNSAYFYPKDASVQLQFVTQPGGGAFQIRRGIEGALVATVSTSSPTPGVGTYSYALDTGETALTIQPVAGSGSFTILGQNNLRPSAGGAVRVHRAANGGWGVENFLQRDFTFDRQLELLDADLYMIWIGQNDPEYTRTQYSTAISQMVDRVKSAAPSAEVVLIGTHDSNSPHLSTVLNAISDVASSRGLGFINLFQAAGSYNFLLQNNFLQEPPHFSPAGGAYIGRMLYDAFMTDGASLERSYRKLRLTMESAGLPPSSNTLARAIPEPSAAVFVAGGAVLLGRRRVALR